MVRRVHIALYILLCNMEGGISGCHKGDCDGLQGGLLFLSYPYLWVNFRPLPGWGGGVGKETAEDCRPCKQKGRSVAQLVGKYFNSATGYKIMTTLNSLGTNDWTGIAGVDGNACEQVQVHLQQLPVCCQ